MCNNYNDNNRNKIKEEKGKLEKTEIKVSKTNHKARIRLIGKREKVLSGDNYNNKKQEQKKSEINRKKYKNRIIK